MEQKKLSTNKPNDVDSYIAGFPDDIQDKLKKLREIIKNAAPEAEEVISYQMPAYRQNGMLVYFAAQKNHIGFYPTSSGIEEFKDELGDFKWSKGTIQFPLDKPLPVNLITRIVKFRVKENLEKRKKNETKENYKKFHNDGSLWATGAMINGLQEGNWRWYRKDGTIMRSGYFKNGKQVGEWITFDKNGKVYKVTKKK